MLDQLKHAAIHSLQQLNMVVAQLSNEQYAMSLPILFGSTIGMHTRHILEFYLCFLRGEVSENINYDARARNMQLENDIDITQNAIAESITALQNIKYNKSISLFNTISDNAVMTAIPTSTMRELTYLIEHAIHHMAIVKMALSQHNIQILIPENFGVAYSTIKHKELCAQ